MPETRRRRARGVPTAGGVLLAAALIALLASSPAVRAQANDDCLTCHSDPEAKGARKGKEISVHVDPRAFASSVHGQLECVNCHQDLAGAELPHAEDLQPVDCSPCHEEVAKAQHESLHGKAEARGDRLAPSCKFCHGSHEIRSHTDPASPTSVMRIPFLCGQCHHEGTEVSLQRDIPQDRILENYSFSGHAEGLFKKGLTVTAVCTSCHTSHRILPHTDPESSIHSRNIVRTCTACHQRIEEVHRKVVEGRLWEEEPHKIPVCVDCHSPHKVRRVFYPAGMANKDCLRCHSRPDLAMKRDGETVPLFVDEAAYAASMHGKVACAQCHTEVSPSKVRSCETITSKVDCGICHAEPVRQYNEGIHGALHAKGDPDAPVCLDCHAKHSTAGKNNPSSPTYARNVPTLCARCHRAGEKAAVRIKTDVPDIVQSYNSSVHGKGLIESGLVVTATCADCHTPHRELPPADPNSSVNRANLADTCGQCHKGIRDLFQTSIHWPANVQTDKKLPVCEDCHSSHQISRVDRPDFRFHMMELCGNCHLEESKTFFDTFHGKSSRLGSAGAAKCYDCHGTHDILPAADPRSHLSLRNVVKTCGQCHTGSHRQFAGYLTHATHHDPVKYPYLYWAFIGMTTLLVGTLTFALIHTFAWLWRLWRTRHQWKRHRAVPGELFYRRFDRVQRTMHLVMLVCFFTLALTGMALKFSYMRWAEILSWLLGGSESMGVLHRIAAVTLIGVFAFHIFDLSRRRKALGRSWWKMIAGPDSLLPNLTDVKESFASIKWFFGMGPRPSYGRYTYWEKFDYFAVFWGVFVIGSTGLVLWFPEFFTRILPGWSVNVATIVHSDEALLAVGFIFTIHFFNTHFRPDKFPMDPVMFTGRVPLEEFKYDKPREYEDLVKSGRLEKHLVEAFPADRERAFRVFGFVALATGLTLIALIVYAMLFGYR